MLDRLDSTAHIPLLIKSQHWIRGKGFLARTVSEIFEHGKFHRVNKFFEVRMHEIWWNLLFKALSGASVWHLLSYYCEEDILLCLSIILFCFIRRILILCQKNSKELIFAFCWYLHMRSKVSCFDPDRRGLQLQKRILILSENKYYCIGTFCFLLIFAHEK